MLLRNYAYLSSHRTVAQVIAAGGIIVASSDPLAITIMDYGAVDAADAEFGSIAAGPIVNSCIIVQTSGPTGGDELPQDAQRLICFINHARSLPFTPNGRLIVCRWSNGAERVFQS